MSVPSAHSFTSNMSTGVEFKDIENYYEDVHRPPHCITDPKAYVSGSATHPPPEELTQENLYVLCGLSSFKCYNNSGSDNSDSNSSSSDSDCIDCKLELADFTSNARETVSESSESIIINNDITDSNRESTILLTQNAHSTLIQQWNDKIENMDVEKEYNAFVMQLDAQRQQRQQNLIQREKQQQQQS